MAPSSYYRSPTKAPATRWARHIDAWMRRENLSKSAAFRLLREAFGLGPESRSAFLPYLEDKPLDDAQQAAVAEIIGSWPAEVEETAKEPGPSFDATRLFGALTQALEVQARYLTQIEDLRAEVAAGRASAEEQRLAQADQLGRLEARLTELRDLVGSQAVYGLPDPAGQG